MERGRERVHKSQGERKGMCASISEEGTEREGVKRGTRRGKFKEGIKKARGEGVR